MTLVPDMDSHGDAPAERTRKLISKAVRPNKRPPATDVVLGEDWEAPKSMVDAEMRDSRA